MPDVLPTYWSFLLIYSLLLHLPLYTMNFPPILSFPTVTIDVVVLKIMTHSAFDLIVLVFTLAALLSVIFSLSKQLFLVKEVLKATTCYLSALNVRQAKSANSGHMQWDIHQ